MLKAPATPYYMTRLPDRNPQYKRHNTFAQAKQAIKNYPNLRGGKFLYDMELLRYDPHQDEYVTWLNVKEGARPADYPELADGYVDSTDPYLSISAAATLLKTSKDKVRALVKEKGLTQVTLGDRIVRLLRSEVEAHRVGEVISAFYQGQLAPVPEGVERITEEEEAQEEEAQEEEAQAWAKYEQAEREGKLIRSAPPEVKTVVCGTLPGLCQVREDRDPDEPTEGHREFALNDEEIEEALEAPAPVADELAEARRKLAQQPSGKLVVPQGNWCYVIAHNRREYMEWCARKGEDPDRPDWIYVHDFNWLRKHSAHAERGYRYLLTPRAQERRDWPDIAHFLRGDEAVRVYPDCVEDAPAEVADRMRRAISRRSTVIHTPSLREIATTLVELSSALRRSDQHRQDALPVLPAVYPLTVIAARYRGTYEGAPFVAFNDRPEDLEGAMGDDITCGSFFHFYERFKPIGRGQSPDEAIRDLAARLG